MNGTLEIICGPMFSGKSTHLIKTIKLLSKFKLLIIKSSLDIRYNSNAITTHNKECVSCIVTNSLEDIENNYNIKEYDYIIIDEAQFIDDLDIYVSKWLDLYKINIILAGLNCDYNRNPIGKIINLFSIADNIIILKAHCKLCDLQNNLQNNNAIFSHLLQNSNLQNNNLQSNILIGGDDKYMSLCRIHYNQKIKNEISL
jgi:thymidine kinase